MLDVHTIEQEIRRSEVEYKRLIDNIRGVKRDIESEDQKKRKVDEEIEKIKTSLRDHEEHVLKTKKLLTDHEDNKKTIESHYRSLTQRVGEYSAKENDYKRKIDDLNRKLTDIRRTLDLRK